MSTVLYSHPICLEHDTGAGHPESIERLRAVLDRLSGPAFASLERRTAPRAERSQIARAHDISYLSKVFELVPETGEAWLAPDTRISAASGEAALRAAGSVVAAVDAVAAGEARNAFCAVRPPGHHSAAGNTMGFCIFNNLAVGIEHARKAHGYCKVAAVDFDVHHGNGTQAIYRKDPQVLFASIHQSFTFPKSGDACETGVGNIINVPLVRKTSREAFKRAFEEKIIPRLRQFRPEMLFISAGFDAHVRDPIGEQRLMTEDFTWLTETLLRVAEDYCDGRVVSVLEGGYNPEALADCCEVHVKALMAAAADQRRRAIFSAAV